MVCRIAALVMATILPDRLGHGVQGLRRASREPDINSDAEALCYNLALPNNFRTLPNSRFSDFDHEITNIRNAVVDCEFDDGISIPLSAVIRIVCNPSKGL